MDRLPGWTAAVRAAGSTAPEAEIVAAGRDLLARWDEPHRRYHNRDHLQFVLTALDEGAGDRPPAPVVLAAWFHDAVYAGRTGEDERASATLVERVLAELGVPGTTRAEVARLVLLTATHDPAPDDTDGALLVDADLAILAVDDAAYRRYTEAVRAEHGHVPEATYRAGRSAVLRRLVAAPTLYRLPGNRDRWEARARANVGAELRRLAPEQTVAIEAASVRFGATVALPRTSLHVRAGEAVAVMGPSGSGKSTLLGLIAGTLTASSGDVVVLGHDLGRLSSAQRAAVRRRDLGLIFQDADLLPELDVAENVALLPLFDGVARSRALAQARDALAEVGLAGAEGMRVDRLSGGERQRVAVARALVRSSMRLLVADEPTASLDAAMTDDIASLIVERVRARGASLILATHDESVAARCDRVHLLRPHLAHVMDPVQ